MTERKETELMHAVLDGEATPEETEALESLLAADPEARTRFGELRALDRALDSLPELDPPPGLAGEVLARMCKPRLHVRMFAQLFEGTILFRYAAAFGAGLLITAAVYEIGGPATFHDDVAALAGTMASRGEVQLQGATVRRAELALPEVAGSLAAHRRDGLLVLALDLDSAADVDIVLPLADGVRVLGFADLDGHQPAVTLSPGEFRIKLAGPYHYAVFMGGTGEALPVEIHRGGAVIHRVALEMPGPG